MSGVAPMSSVVDVLISSARSVGRSGNPPAFLSFARGASTAAVSLPPLFPPSVGSSPSRSDYDVCRLSSQLFTPLSWFHPPLYHFLQLFVLFLHWVRKMATYFRTCHCHQYTATFKWPTARAYGALANMAVSV